MRSTTTPSRRAAFPLGVALLGCLALSPLGPRADAATFVVDTTSDLALGACAALVAADCSLRGAIIAANLSPDQDTIEFAIPPSDPGFVPATGHWRISVPDPGLLPGITQPLMIDGYSQPGAVPNSNTPAQGGLNGTLKIEIHGSNPLGNANYGLQLDSAQTSAIRGLAINNFRDGQVFVRGAAPHRIEGCYLGTDITGNLAQVLSNGILLAGNGPYIIGGLLPEQRNLLSGLNNALLTSQQAANGVLIQGNLIGTNAAGNAVIGNQFGLLLFRMSNSLVGGTVPAARNVFSGHRGQAIILQVNNPGVFDGLQIEGNYFGTDVSGRLPLGNALVSLDSTIQINGAGGDCGASIGGSAPGQANLIAYSAGVGIRNANCLGVRNTLNRFLGNANIAFDNIFGSSGSQGATANDPGDADSGGNRLQNHPDLVVPGSAGSSVALQYRVDSTIANSSYPITVNFYRGDCGGGSRALLGSDTIQSAQAQQSIDYTLTSADGGNILPLTATAVDAAGNTSEFAPMLGDAVFRSGFEDTAGAPTAGSCDH